MGQVIGGAQQQPEGPNNPEVAWWCKLLAKIIGTIAGIVCLILGIWTLISIHWNCIVAGVLMVLGSAIVIMFEAPICCAYLDVTKPVAAFAEKRTFFQKAIIYAIIAIIPFAMCFGLLTLFGCGLVFAAAVFYGLMALGKKADREQMMSQAAQQQGTMPVPPATADDSKINLMEGEHGGNTGGDAWGADQGGYGGGGYAQPQASYMPPGPQGGGYGAPQGTGGYGGQQGTGGYGAPQGTGGYGGGLR